MKISRTHGLLAERIERWAFDKSTEFVLDRLIGARASRDELSDAIFRWLVDNAGCIFQLMEYVALISPRMHKPNDRMGDFLSTFLERQVAEDAQRQSGLSELAESALELSGIELTQALTNEMVAQPAALDLLWTYLPTGKDAAIVGEVQLRQVVDVLEAHARADEAEP